VRCGGRSELVARNMSRQLRVFISSDKVPRRTGLGR
jgi:hypothetical protein